MVAIEKKNTHYLNSLITLNPPLAMLLVYTVALFRTIILRPRCI